MSGAESEESGDALRDAVMSQALIIRAADYPEHNATVSEVAFNEEWVTPSQLVASAPGAESGTRKRWVMERLRGGVLRATARISQVRLDLDYRQPFCPVPLSAFDRLEFHDLLHFWSTGDLITSYGRFYDVRVDPASLSGKPQAADFLHPPITPHLETAVVVNKGGRPPKAFWDDMWAAIAAQLYEGDLKPTKQADIENAMHDWLVGNSHDAGQTQVRDRARKLWKSLGN